MQEEIKNTETVDEAKTEETSKKEKKKAKKSDAQIEELKAEIAKLKK